MRVGPLKLTRVSSMLFMAVAWATAAFAQTATTYGGEATALSGVVADVPLSLSGTGMIDPLGGARNNSLVCYPGGPECYVGVPDLTSGLLSVQVLNAVTVGRGDKAESYASVANFATVVNGVPVTAAFVAGMVKSQCQGDLPGDRVAVSTASSEFSQLVIGGMTIPITELPNQTVSVASPLGGSVRVTVNEQSVRNGYLTVRALRLEGPSIAGVVNATDMSVATGNAKINCADVDKCFAEKVTGGGFIIVDGARISFAASGRNIDTWGHVVAINHATGDKFKSTIQQTAFFAEEGYAVIYGSGLVNGTDEVTFTARLKDNGEPGRNDTFSLSTSDGTFVFPLDNTLAGGNIQFHKPKGECPVPDPLPVLCDIDSTAPVCGVIPGEERAPAAN